MATETEIERLVVRIVGDQADLIKTYGQAKQATQQLSQSMTASGQGMERSLQPASSGLMEVSINARDARRSLMLLAAGGFLPAGATHDIFIAAQGMMLLKSAAVGAAAGMGTLKVAMLSTGIGAIVVALGSMAASLAHVAAQARMSREAASGAFGTMASGARTAQQALTDMRINIITEGFEELADTVNPGFWENIWQGIQGMAGLNAIDRAINKIVNRSRAAREFFQALTNDPRMMALQREVALDRNALAARDLAMAQGELAARSGLAERAAARMEAAQRMAREANITLEQAQIRLAASYDRIDASGRRIDMGRMTLQLRELAHEADRALTETGQRITAMAQEFMRANPSVRSLEEAFRMLAPILDETRTQMNRMAMGNFLRGLREQSNVMGLSAERAELFRMSMEGVSQAQIRAALGAVKHMEALKGMLAPLERLEGARAGSVESLARIAEYQRSMTMAVRTGTMRQQLLADQQAGLAAPGGVAMAGAGAVGAMQGQEGMLAMANRLIGGVGMAPRPQGGARPVDPVQVDILAVLRQIRDANRPIGGGAGIPVPGGANLAGGGM